MPNLSSTLALLLATASTALAHWNYDSLIVKGHVIGTPYQYIRKTNNSNTPIQTVNSTDMRCNSGGASGASTETYTVNAGDELGFTIASTFGHPGIQQVYLSRAPGLAKEYKGEGEWTRIYSLTSSLSNTTTLSNSSSSSNSTAALEWATHKLTNFTFSLPASVPPGEYLLRAEGLALHAAHKLNCAQFYIACAQIRIMGNGTGNPGPGVKFPGGYKVDSPGVLIPVFWSMLTQYTAPGPRLWPSGTGESHVAETI